MKIHHLMLLVTICSCTGVYFAEPQPPGSANLSQFPENYWGAYIELGESGENEEVKIYKTGYSYQEEFKKSISVSELDQSDEMKIEGKLLFDNSLPKNNGIEFTLKDDTVSYQTILNVSNNLGKDRVLKKYKKFLVLNEFEDEKYWNVYLIEKLSNGNLKVWTAHRDHNEDSTADSSKNDLKEFFTITDFQQLKDDQYLIDPTKSEFKKLVKKGLFIEGSEYSKIQ
jgi:hypothetical protein